MARKKAMTKLLLRKLEGAAKQMEKAASDAFAALWYLERDAHKGISWGCTAIYEARRALARLEELFPGADP